MSRIESILIKLEDGSEQKIAVTYPEAEVVVPEVIEEPEVAPEVAPEAPVEAPVEA